MTAAEEGTRLVQFFQGTPGGNSVGVTALEAREAVSHNPIISYGRVRNIVATPDGTGTFTLTSEALK